MLLEICAYNIISCSVAARGGASRIEFCASPEVGGTTPVHEDVRYLLGHIAIPIYPIIRPRGGGYVFNDEEIETIKSDILRFRDMGCRGISTGAANPDGTINGALMRQIVELAGPMEVTCHKVFDETPDAFGALETLISCGVTRILTSGLQPTAAEGAKMLAQLVKHAAGRVIVMPGGSVRSSNIASLIAETAAVEYHSSAIVENKDRSFAADEWEVLFFKAVGQRKL